MPALDRDHKLVRRALEKEGWTITHDPLTLSIGKRNLLMDFGAERLLAAERGTEKIAVEVKTFAGPSPIADLQQAYGQLMLKNRFRRLCVYEIDEEKIIKWIP